MSRIDDLIAERAQKGVTFRELGDVIKLSFGTRITKREHSGTRYPVYGGGGASFLTDDFNREDEYVVSRFAISEACVRKVAGKFWMLDSGFTFEVTTPDVLKDFVAFWLFNRQREIYACSSEGAQKNLKTEEFKRFRFPVPPLEVQRETVKVLDRFTELEAALKAELEARRNQRVGVGTKLRPAESTYTPDGWERAKLGSLVRQRVDPVQVSSDDVYVNLGVKWYGEGAFAREPKPGSAIKARTLYRVRSGQFIYNRMFVTEGSFGLVTPELADGVVSNEFPVFDVELSRVLPEWLFLTFQDPVIVRRAATETTGGTKSRRRWKEDQFLAFEIDLPPLAVQSEIVRVHRALVGLESELAAELNARRKQYEYYRDRLLTFPEAA